MGGWTPNYATPSTDTTRQPRPPKTNATRPYAKPQPTARPQHRSPTPPETLATPPAESSIQKLPRPSARLQPSGGHSDGKPPDLPTSPARPVFGAGFFVFTTPVPPPPTPPPGRRPYIRGVPTPG